MPLAKDIIGLILAGGESKRFGRPKALAKLKNKPLMAWVFEALRKVCEEIWLSVKDFQSPETNCISPSRIIVDPIPYQGPLQALFSILRRIPPHKALLVVACDQPLLQEKLLKGLVSKAQENLQAPAIICQDKKKRYPFPGIYRPIILKGICCTEYKSFQQILEKKGGLFLPSWEWQKFDPQGYSFFNINYEKNLKKAEKILNSFYS